MKKTVRIIILFSFLSSFLNGQVLNIDRENGTDTIFKKFKFATFFSFSSDKQKNNLIDFFNQSEFDYFDKNNRVLIFLNQIETSFSGLTALENNGYFQIRFRDNDSRKIYPDYFSQFQWNGIQGLESRFLLGCNLRYRLLEKKSSDLYLSSGVFYEDEKWNPFLSEFAFNIDNSLGIVNRKLIRFNLASKFAFKISKRIDFTGVSFFQFPINSFFDKPRWFFDSNLFYEVNQVVSLELHYDHNFDTYRPLPIDKYYYNLTLGVNINI